MCVERRILWRDPFEKILQISARRRSRILLNDQGRGGVRAENG
jgi:hypothetical protein